MGSASSYSSLSFVYFTACVDLARNIYSHCPVTALIRRDVHAKMSRSHIHFAEKVVYISTSMCECYCIMDGGFSIKPCLIGQNK